MPDILIRENSVFPGISANTGVAPPRSAKIHLGPGFRIKTDFLRPPTKLLEAFRGLDVADLSDQMNRLYAVAPEIKLLSAPGAKLIGPACTVRVYPGDNLMVHKSLDIAKPGDVVVIDAHASVLNAVLGDMICTKPNIAESRASSSTAMSAMWRSCFSTTCLYSHVAQPL